jgi:flavin-dependent dehydrogenase
MTRSISNHSHYDAIVVGARCAGAATAMLLARRGLRVLALERQAYGSDTLSTHALMRAGVLQLHRWGLLKGLADAGTPDIRWTSFHYGDEETAVPIKPRDGVDALYAPRRTLLDRLLVDAARAAGAEVEHRVRVVDLRRNPGGRVSGVVAERDGQATEIGAGIVIGADGLRSTVARLVEAEVEHAGRHATGVVYGYWTGLELGHTHWYYRERVGVGAIPTNDGAACIFAGCSGLRFRDEIRSDIVAGHGRLLEECAPELAAELRPDRQLGRHFAFTGAAGFLRQSFGDGWALVGDAGYFRDPITAHGMTDALRDAELLARAVEAGTERELARYQEQRDELALELHDISDRIASFEWTLDEVRDMHLALSREMNREVEAIIAWQPQAAGRTPLGLTA